MTNDSFYHVPFARLPREARVLFFLFSLGALRFYRLYAPPTTELAAEVERIWNSERPAPIDLEDEELMTDLLKRRLAKYGGHGFCRSRLAA